MFFEIFEFLTAPWRETHFEKVRKSEKLNVNGAGTYSMFRGNYERQLGFIVCVVEKLKKANVM